MRVVCSALEPITFRPVEERLGQTESADNTFDTDETIKQIRAHNAAWLELCGVY